MCALEEIHEAVKAYTSSSPASVMPLAGAEKFEKIVAHLRAKFNVADSLCLRMNAALITLLPDFPPDEAKFRRIASEILNLMVSHGVVDPEEQGSRVAEFVLAWGCGWRGVGRDLESACSPEAVLAQAEALKPYLFKAGRSLGFYELGLREEERTFKEGPERKTSEDQQAQKSVPNTNVSLDAHKLAYRLSVPEFALGLQPKEFLEIASIESGWVVTKGFEYQSLEILPGAKWVAAISGDGAVLQLWQKSSLGQDGSPELQLLKHFLVPEGSRLVLTAQDEGVTIKIYTGGSYKKIRIKNRQSVRLIAAAGCVPVKISHCTCGHVKCVSLHRLSSWDPSKCDLWHFLRVCVFGLGSLMGGVKPGSFAQGMYYAMLSLEGLASKGQAVRLRCVPVEFAIRVCPKCTDPEGKPLVCAGSECPQCGQSSSVSRVISKRKIITVGSAGEYVREVRWRCSKCGSLYSHDALASILLTSQKSCNKGGEKPGANEAFYNLTVNQILKKLAKRSCQCADPGCSHQKQGFTCRFCGEILNIAQRKTHVWVRSPYSLTGLADERGPSRS
jgi:hypothetical protein